MKGRGINDVTLGSEGFLFLRFSRFFVCFLFSISPKVIFIFSCYLIVYFITTFCTLREWFIPCRPFRVHNDRSWWWYSTGITTFGWRSWTGVDYCGGKVLPVLFKQMVLFSNKMCFVVLWLSPNRALNVLQSVFGVERWFSGSIIL